MVCDFSLVVNTVPVSITPSSMRTIAELHTVGKAISISISLESVNSRIIICQQALGYFIPVPEHIVISIPIKRIQLPVQELRCHVKAVAVDIAGIVCHGGVQLPPKTTPRIVVVKLDAVDNAVAVGIRVRFVQVLNRHDAQRQRLVQQAAGHAPSSSPFLRSDNCLRRGSSAEVKISVAPDHFTTGSHLHLKRYARIRQSRQFEIFPADHKAF